MPRVRLQAKSIDKLTTTSQTDYFDEASSVPGFGIRVSAGGRRTWFLMYRQGGQQKRATIGTYPTMGLAKARDVAGRQLLDVQVNEADPAAAKKARRSAQTFGELAEQYLTLHAKAKKRSWREDGRQLRTMVLPHWKNRPAVDITKSHVSALIDNVAATRGGVTANRLHALLSKVFRWALSKDKVQGNPVAGLQRPAGETSRDRELSPNELRALWARLDDAEREKTLPLGVVLWMRLRALTAQRGGSVAKMKWADVDLERKIWDIPSADMKSKKAHVVPLSGSVCELLKAQRETLPSDAVYVLEGGRSRRLRLGVKEAMGLDNFTPHDLRRTAATGMARVGVSRFIIERVLGHVDRTVTAIYDRYEYLNEKRVALDAWARQLQSIIDDTISDNVVPFSPEGRR
jgi:integrase